VHNIYKVFFNRDLRVIQVTPIIERMKNKPPKTFELRGNHAIVCAPSEKEAIDTFYDKIGDILDRDGF